MNVVAEREKTTLVEELNDVAVDVVRDVRKNKTIIPLVLVGLLLAVLAVLFIAVIPLLKTAEEAGSALGETSGRVAGLAVGSVEGATQGIQEGLAAGAAEGLSAKDTEAEIANIIETNVNGFGNLEVLVAIVNLTNYHEVGEMYDALYVTRASAVFSVDLSQITVTCKEGLVSVVIPQPEAEIKVDPTDTKALAEWQRPIFNGTDSQGFEAYLNSFTETTLHAEEQVENYPVLLQMASDSAVRQVMEIANAVRGNDDYVEVRVSVQAD